MFHSPDCQNFQSLFAKSFVINLYLTETEEIEIQTKFVQKSKANCQKIQFSFVKFNQKNILKVHNLFIR